MYIVVSEKKIFEISANQRLLWALAAMLDDRSEQKVTTLDKDLQGTFLPSMVPIHPVVLEKKLVLHISHGVAVKLCPPGGHLGFSIGPKSNNTWLAACNDHS